MQTIFAEMSRVLRNDRFFVIVIGSNEIQTGGILFDKELISFAPRFGFSLEKSMLKPIRGIQNSMTDEYVLFFRKVFNMSDVVRTKELTIYYLSSDQINRLQNSSDLFDVILLTPPFNYIEKNKPFKYTDSHDQIDYLNNIMTWLDESVSHLDKHGAILVYGIPRWLPYFAEFLSQRMTFKYWIVLKTTSLACDTSIMQPSHDGVLLFVKDRKNFTINRVRYPHIYCSQCGDFLADWGGKKHLRPEYGPIISDIWDDRNDLVDQNNKLTPITLERLLI